MGDRLRFVFRNFPLQQVHPHAQRAAETAEAAAAQGKFWEMHSQLFENQRALEDPDLLRYASALDLDVDRVKTELLDRKTHGARPAALHERRSQRRQRHPHLLYQRTPARRRL